LEQAATTTITSNNVRLRAIRPICATKTLPLFYLPHAALLAGPSKTG
jgi:hypothetical protein